MKNALQNEVRGKASKPFSYRPPAALVPRLNAVVTVSRRTRASVLDESLEVQLPVLEKRHARELRRHRVERKQTKTP